MSPAADLPPHAKKAVMGRLLGFEVLAPYLSWLQEQGHHDAAVILRERLCWLTNDSLNDLESGESLSSFLSKLVSKLNADAAELPRGAREAVAGVVQEFSKVVAAFVASPYDPLQRLFEAVAQTAADFYRAYGVAVPSELWDQTLPVVSVFGGKVGLSFAPDIHLQAQTEFGSDDSPSASVVLTISPRWLDAETIATLPRALLHEYISHVPQGPYLGARLHPDINDLFAEGWMDYVAHYIHREVVERQGTALDGCLVQRWTSLYEAAADRFYGARCANEYGDAVAAARKEGAFAARQMHDLLRRLPETKACPDEHLYRLSFGLNASKLGNDSRRRVAAEVRHCLLRASRLDVLVPAIRDWAQGRTKLEDLSARLLA